MQLVHPGTLSERGSLVTKSECGSDKGGVHQPLWKISEQCTVGSNVFGVQAEMIGMPNEFPHRHARPLQLAAARETFDVPERTDRERGRR
jgi:hypothetical protein